VRLHRYLLILTGVLIIALILVVWFLPSNDDFRLDNPFWNGSNYMKAEYQARPLNSLADLPSSPNKETLLIIPYTSSTPTDLDRLNSFTSRGGRLIIADDYGHGNEILEYLGLEARFSGQVLLDPLVNYQNKNFPRITYVEPDPLTVNTDNLVFNHATSLLNISENCTLATSSHFSFLDYNGDGTGETQEPTGPLPVISRHQLGYGQVILISDPSIFINSMDTIGSNKDFIQNIADTSSVLYIDQSHLVASELHHTRDWLQQARDILSNPIWTAVLVFAAIIAALVPIWYKKKKPTVDN
jgi:hypothetical protein